MVIVATSDQHLGYRRADKKAFLEFLDGLALRTDITDFVIVGDFVDMWRRDVSGVFLENRDIVEKLLGLRTKMNVHLVAGNHDFHSLQLKNHEYPLQFLKDLLVERDGKKYRFFHGHEWDDLQKPIFMEALCRVMSDSVGEDLTKIWDIIEGGKGFLARYRLPSGFGRSKTIETLKALRRNPETRLKETLGEIETKICRAPKKDEVLVFGHTHRPFVNKKENVVNTGSWVSASPIHNTFVELSPERISLRVFKGREISERI
mgnify:CR=1 FL=1